MKKQDLIVSASTLLLALTAGASFAGAEPPSASKPFAAGEPPSASKPFAAGEPPAASKPFAAGEPPAASRPFAAGEPPAASRPFAAGEPPAASRPFAAGEPPGTTPAVPLAYVGETIDPRLEIFFRKYHQNRNYPFTDKEISDLGAFPNRAAAMRWLQDSEKNFNEVAALKERFYNDIFNLPSYKLLRERLKITDGGAGAVVDPQQKVKLLERVERALDRFVQRFTD